MKKRSWKGWSYAVCLDCGWELERINAQGVGARHAKTHKHKVLVTTEIESSYDGRDSLLSTTREKKNG